MGAGAVKGFCQAGKRKEARTVHVAPGSPADACGLTERLVDCEVQVFFARCEADSLRFHCVLVVRTYSSGR